MARVIATYQIALYDATGTKLAILDDYRSLQFKSEVNGQGFFTLILNANDPKRDLFEVNGIIEIKRKIPGVVDWYTEFTGHVENFQDDVFQNGNEQFTVVGSNINGLLARRVIAYYEGTIYAAKNDAAETVMKARQSGMDIVELTDLVDNNDLYLMLIKHAYDKPLYTTYEYKNNAIIEFKNTFYLACIKNK